MSYNIGVIFIKPFGFVLFVWLILRLIQPLILCWFDYFVDRLKERINWKADNEILKFLTDSGTTRGVLMGL